MFDSVLDRGVVARGRLGTGTLVSVVGHAVVLTLALMVKAPARVESPVPDVRFFLPKGPGLGPGSPGPAAQPGPRKPARRPRDVVSPLAIPTTPPPEVEAPPEVEPSGEPVIGTRIGDQIGTREGPPGDGGGGGGGGEIDASLFLPGMTHPVLLSGEAPHYTREALEARVQGTMIVRCVVTLAGTVGHCRVIKGLPFMEKAVVEALMSRRYQPATFEGQPVAVDYAFTVRLVLPH